MKVCIYSRGSTGQQDATNQSVGLSEWAKQRGFKVVKVYEEVRETNLLLKKLTDVDKAKS